MPTVTVSRCGGAATPATLTEAIIADTALYAFYRLSEPSGLVAGDSGPGGLHLTVNGVPVWGGAAGPPGEQTAVFANDWNATRATGFASLSTSDMTVEVWIKRTADNFAPAVGQGLPVSGVTGFVLGAFTAPPSGTGFAFITVGNGASRDVLAGTVTPVIVGSWFYLAATKLSNVWRLYVNGVQEPGTMSSVIAGTTDFGVGGAGGFGVRAQESYAVIRDRSLSSAEVLANYQLAVP